MQNDIVSKNYTEYLEISSDTPTIEHIPFTLKEIHWLWDNVDDDSAKVLLILLCTGMRVNELLKLPKEHCHFDEDYFYVPKELAKNKSSIRPFPIHPKVKPLVKVFYERDSDFLMIKKSGAKIMYNNFVSRDLVRLNKNMEFEHKFHDTRHTFLTVAKEKGMDEVCRKLIAGHVIKDITNKVYTHTSLDTLKKEICKVQY